MKTLKIAGLAALVLMVIALSIRLLSGDEDVWLCRNGRWVKHGAPSALEPTTACGNQNQVDKSYLIVVDSPKQGDKVTSPLVVTGKARGNWFFEASFPVELIDSEKNVIVVAPAQAKGEWMTTEFVPFEVTLNFKGNFSGQTGILILKKDNPSGLPQFDDKLEIPVRFGAGETMIVKAFFSNNNLDKEITCVKAFPAERQTAKTVSVARAALEELLKGPSQGELAQGFYTSINPNVKIQKLTITNETAKVDFDETLEAGMGGSCRVSAIRAQITETLKQFPTVKNVIISINGRTEVILQP